MKKPILRNAGALDLGWRRGLQGLAAGLLLPLWLAACNGGGSDGNPPATADTTPPTLLSTSPANNANAVPADASVSATFSEEMDAATLTTATFTLNVASVAVPGIVSTSGSTATFTPSSPLPGGTLYTATVSTAAKDAAGNPLGAASSWSFTTVDSVATQAWSTPVLLDNLDGFAAVPVIAATSGYELTAAARATAVWIQDDGAEYSVYASQYRQGVWEGPVLVENESKGNGAGASNPSVAMGDFGRTVVTWTYGGNGSYAVWGNAFDGGFSSAPATYARQLSPVGGGNASSSKASIDGSGHDVFVVWQQYDASRQPAAYRIAQRQYLYVPCEFQLPCAWNPADFGWRATTFVEINSNDAGSPQVSAWGSGNAVAVWPKFSVGLWANTHATPDGWATPVRVNPATSNSVFTPMVAAAADGTAVAVWIDNGATRWTLFASRLSGGAWSAPIALDDVTAGTADNPQVVVDVGGNAMVVWTQGGVGSGTLYARRCPSGPLTACGAIKKIGSPTGEAAAVRLATAPNGDAITVWTQLESSRRIQANHYTAATDSWKASPLLLDGADSSEPQIAIDKRGTATAVWSKTEFGKTNIYASRY